MSRNKDELVTAIQRLTSEDAIAKTWPMNRRAELHFATEEVLRRLHNFLAAAFGLVDHMRVHKRRYLGTDFDAEIQREINTRFASDDDHLIAQNLRVIALHYRTLPVHAGLSVNSSGEARLLCPLCQRVAKVEGLELETEAYSKKYGRQSGHSYVCREILWQGREFLHMALDAPV